MSTGDIADGPCDLKPEGIQMKKGELGGRHAIEVLTRPGQRRASSINGDL